MTPFLCAVAAGHTWCAKILLESGAEMTARDKYQRCCVHLAVENDKEDVLKMLLERNGPGLTNVPDIRERTALHYAALSSNIRVRINKSKMQMFDYKFLGKFSHINIIKYSMVKDPNLQEADKLD